MYFLGLLTFYSNFNRLLYLLLDDDNNDDLCSICCAYTFVLAREISINTVCQNHPKELYAYVSFCLHACVRLLLVRKKYCCTPSARETKYILMHELAWLQILPQSRNVNYIQYVLFFANNQV